MLLNITVFGLFVFDSVKINMLVVKRHDFLIQYERKLISHMCIYLVIFLSLLNWVIMNEKKNPLFTQELKYYS